MRSYHPLTTVFETASRAADALEHYTTTGTLRKNAPANSPREPSGDLDDLAAELSHILDMVLFFLNGGRDVDHLVELLVLQLHELRADCAPETWRALVPMARAHPIHQMLMADPFTRRSFLKPRGYSGDGVLLDLIYRHPAVQGEVAASSQLGKDIYACTSISSSARAVQERREILARFVDAAAVRRPGAEILTVASGHLREAELCSALAEGDVSRWIAMDQDEANLAVIGTDFAATAVDPMLGSVKGLLAQQHDIGAFDLIYSAGVYDYLPFEGAVALTRLLLASVRPGGTLLFGNFSTEVVTDGYMETFMDWSLFFRDETEMRALIEAASAGLDLEADLFFGQNRHILYAQILKPN